MNQVDQLSPGRNYLSLLVKYMLAHFLAGIQGAQTQQNRYSDSQQQSSGKLASGGCRVLWIGDSSQRLQSTKSFVRQFQYLGRIWFLHSNCEHTTQGRYSGLGDRKEQSYGPNGRNHHQLYCIRMISMEIIAHWDQNYLRSLVSFIFREYIIISW